MRTVRVLPQKYPQLAGRFSNVSIAAPSSVDYSWGAISKPDGSPAFRYVFDPDPKFIRAGAGDIGPDALRDSASGLKWSTNAGKALVKAAAINGKPTLTLDGATALFGPAGLAKFSHEEFSFFAVFNTPVAATVRTLMGPAEPTSTTPLQGSLNLLLSTAGLLNVYMGSTSAPLIDTDHVYQGVNVLVLVTFSTQRGITIRRNGDQVVKDATRVTPISGTTFNLFSASGSGSRFSGSVGKVGVLDVDLSRPEYTKALEAIESHLISFYALPA